MKEISKKNTSFYTNEPFTVFEIKNFLADENYLELLKTFPIEKKFGNSKDGNVIDPTTEYYVDHLEKNEIWKNFILSLNNEKFISEAYMFSLLPSIKARGLRALKKWTVKEKNFLFKKFFRKVSVEAHFTIQRKREYLHLHTDAKSKLLSMIYYFADENTNIQNSGTEFWKNIKNPNLWKNWENKHIVDKNELDKFKLDNKVFFKSIFEKNKLVGFIKSENSWHSVLDHNIEEGEVRRAFVINIREAH